MVLKALQFQKIGNTSMEVLKYAAGDGWTRLMD
jgi:hypothetical protein